MISRKQLCFIIVLGTCLCKDSFAQSIDITQEEDQLARLSAAVRASRDNYDSVTYYSDKFGNELKKYIAATPATLQYSFKRLIDSNYCFIITSLDGNLRIYSWDTNQGGSWHDYDQIIQYKDGGRVFTQVLPYEEGAYGLFCSAIYTVLIKGIIYYLPVSNGTYSNKDASQSISVWTIHDHKLIDTVRLFKTKKRLLNTIHVSFDFFSVVDRPERPLALITYEDKEKVIRIPLVTKNGQVTRRNLLYKLQGDYFTFTGIEPVSLSQNLLP